MEMDPMGKVVGVDGNLLQRIDVQVALFGIRVVAIDAIGREEVGALRGSEWGEGAQVEGERDQERSHLDLLFFIGRLD
jgi:hypothetical protein